MSEMLLYDVVQLIDIVYLRSNVSLRINRVCLIMIDDDYNLYLTLL